MSGMTPGEEAVEARMDEIAAGAVKTAAAEADADYKRRGANALADAWMLADAIATAPSRTKRVPTGTLLLLASTLIDQAAELESLRDKESQPEPRVITEQGELGDLPDRSVVLGADGVAHQASDNGAGRRFWGSEDQSYTFADGVALPATVIWEPRS